MSVYNGENYIIPALESMFSQSFSDFEFILVDDASTDGTARILADYARKDHRLCVLSNSENMGIARSLNLGLEHAKGDYIARMDADDISLPPRLQKQFDFMEAHPEIGVMGTSVELIDADGQVIDERVYPPEPIIIRWRLALENPICHPTVMIRRSHLNDLRYDADLATAQDYHLWCRLSGHTRFANLPEPLLQLRKHGENMTCKSGKEQRQNSLSISRAYIEELLKNPISQEVLGHLWDRDDTDAKESLQIARLMRDLAMAILSETSWSQVERKMLQRYAARWIFDRSRKDLGSFSGLRMALNSARLDPLDFFKRIPSAFISK
jgi:glycosyltransferase involved in cell wall biosynthesis